MSTFACGAVILALALPLAGCAVVKVQASGKDEVEVKRGLGVVWVQVTPGAGAVMVDSVGFGAIHGFDGLSLGYHAASTAAVARDSCRLLVWVRTDEQLKELKELLENRTDVCAVRPEYRTREVR